MLYSLVLGDLPLRNHLHSIQPLIFYLLSAGNMCFRHCGNTVRQDSYRYNALYDMYLKLYSFGSIISLRKGMIRL